MCSNFKHHSLDLKTKKNVVFTAFSKKRFYLRFPISGFVLKEGAVPINPYMNFEYNLAGLVDKKLIRVANNTLLQKSNELWVFGEVSDGVLVEIFLAKKNKIPVRYFVPGKEMGEFVEQSAEDAVLEDVSPWMWERVQAGKNLARWHPRLQIKKTYPLVYPAYSKRNFYWHMQISKYCIEKRTIPLNPFMLFRYFLGGSVPRKYIYEANNNIVYICNQVWCFGEISDGVLAEVEMAREEGKEVKFYKIRDTKPVKFRKIPSKWVKFEDKELEKYRDMLE